MIKMLIIIFIAFCFSACINPVKNLEDTDSDIDTVIVMDTIVISDTVKIVDVEYPPPPVDGWDEKRIVVYTAGRVYVKFTWYCYDPSAYKTGLELIYDSMVSDTGYVWNYFMGGCK